MICFQQTKDTTKQGSINGLLRNIIFVAGNVYFIRKLSKFTIKRHDSTSSK